jgi:hypothetical protein
MAVPETTFGGAVIDDNATTGRVRQTVRTAVVGLAALSIGVLAGCGGGSSTASATAAGATPQAASSGLVTAAPARGGNSPTPTDDQRKQLVYILEAVNPRVSTDASSLVKKSMELCGQMLGGASSSKIADATRQQFTNGSYTPSPAEVQAMEATIVASFCR